ncbi:hypothetical protein Tco_0575150 [Tanacetum coccineum]
MSCTSSSHTAHVASELGHTVSLSRQPIQDSNEDPLEDEVNSIHSPTPTPTSETPTREVSPHPSLPSTYHIGGPSSTDPYVTARASDKYSWEQLMDHLRHPTRPRPDTSRYPHMVTEVPVSHESGTTLEELNKMQYLYGEVQDCRIRVDCQAELLLEMSYIVGRLTQQISRAICTPEGAIMIGRRDWYLGLSVVILVLALVLMVALMFVFWG